LTIAPARQILKQRAEISQMELDLAAVKSENDSLRGETERLNTDAYIEQQARLRLGLIKPGEEPYMIVPPKQVPPQEPAAAAKKPAAVKTKVSPWYQQVIDYISALFS